MINIKDICMTYHTLKEETHAINPINFTVNDGDFLSIIGPSGCGKSTILNIIAGLIQPSSGKIFIDNKEIDSSCSSIGYMFQKDHLFPWLTVYENVCMGLKIQKNLNDKNKNYINELLEKYELLEFKNHYPDQLSGGMRQRVALIRTLAINPKVLLLDEPFSALDYQTRLNISDEIYEIIKKEKKTVIMVTHDISEAVSMSDRVIALSKRPASIENDLVIKFDDVFNTPLKRREAPEFTKYFNTLWKELNKNE